MQTAVCSCRPIARAIGPRMLSRVTASPTAPRAQPRREPNRAGVPEREEVEAYALFENPLASSERDVPLGASPSNRKSQVGYRCGYSFVSTPTDRAVPFALWPTLGFQTEPRSLGSGSQAQEARFGHRGSKPETQDRLPLARAGGSRLRALGVWFGASGSCLKARTRDSGDRVQGSALEA
jgi:hypothetical protein